MSKQILITGATDGIGKATALYLAGIGHNIIVHGRNQKRINDAISEIKRKTGNNNIDYVIADFSSLQEVQAAAESLLQKDKPIDVLINNAAVITPEYMESKDNIELTFQVNYLAHFLLTLQILPLLQAKNDSQIISISSIAHAENLDFSNILNPKYFDPYSAYEISKLANILFTYKLANKLKKNKISVNCLHPGVINTKLLHVLWTGGNPVEKAVEVITNVMEQAEKNHISGKYFTGKYPSRSSDISYDKKVQQKIWDYSIELLTGIINGNFFYEFK